jgi:pyrroline-5-carboxylate reductase
VSEQTIAFIGAGKMASALIGGLVQAGYSPDSIWASCPTAAHLNAIKTQFHIHTTQDNAHAAAQADVLVLSVKPALISEVLSSLQPLITTRKPLIVSIAAGISVAAMRAVVGDEVPIIRCMPNTPALIAQGMSVLYADAPTPPALKHQAEAIFQAVGETLWIAEEAQMAAVTALSGSGPAYFFLMMEALENAGVTLGLPMEIAHHLSVQTAKGSAHLAVQSLLALSELREQVTSKGGGTAQAIQVFESGQFSRLVAQAVAAAKTKYDEN